MLRRRKADVETQLPGPHRQELLRCDGGGTTAALRRLSRAGRATDRDSAAPPADDSRNSTGLQQLLACMRMICDTPAILDPDCRVSPKLEELERILGDLLEDPDRKIIVFSEWERMLTMVRELAGEMGVEAAWHTGSLPQERRRAEINRFKHDPACRLFLSTDSGSVGLNLQVASAVINVDLPWNPAKLEQRIARAWRKNQTRSVTVVNLVTEDTIEHSILHLLGQKQALADGVLDGEGDLAALKMPSGRGAFIERMQAHDGRPPAAARRFAGGGAGGGTGHPPWRQSPAGGGPSPLGRTAKTAGGARSRSAAMAAELARLPADQAGAVDLLDRSTFAAMQRLAATGMLQFTHEAASFHRSAAFVETPPVTQPRPTEGRRNSWPRRSALCAWPRRSPGGFPEEAPALLAKALRAWRRR